MLEKYLIENWERFTKSVVPQTVQLVPISSGFYGYGNDVVLIFVDNATYPEYILKASRNPAVGYKLKREYYSLKNIYNSGKISDYIPTPYYIGLYNQKQFFLQKGVKGNSLLKLIGQKGINKKIQLIINQSIDLLVEIGKTKSSYKLEQFVYNEDVYEVIKEKLTTSSNRRKINKLIEYQQMFKKEGNNFYTHGDYWLANIIVDYKKERINGIIDWEFSQAEVCYPLDLMWFIITLGNNLIIHKLSEKTIFCAYKKVFFTNNVYNDIIASCYRRYMTAIEWDQSLFNKLLEMTLVELSVREWISYGCHLKMDQIWMELLDYTLTNEDKLCIL